jgi:hypothetical protein
MVFHGLVGSLHGLRWCLDDDIIWRHFLPWKCPVKTPSLDFCDLLGTFSCFGTPVAIDVVRVSAVGFG